MRWAVVLLVAVNVAVFYWLNDAGPKRVQDVQEGRLPRVAEIQLVDQSGGGPIADGSSSGQGESETDSGASAQGLRFEHPAPSDISTDEEEGGPVASGQALDQRPVPEANVGLPRECFGVGWFDEEGEARAFARYLGETWPSLEGFGLRERVEPLPDFYWVLIPPLESRQAALERYGELTAEGIEAYVVRSGDNENAISLGLFRSLRSAEQLLSRRQAENIDAILANFPRNRISYALVFGGAPGASELSGRALSAESDGELQLIEISDCEGVATAEENP